MNKKMLLLPMAIGLSTQAMAMQLDAGDDWSVRWDNSFKYNLMMRATDQDADVVNGVTGFDPTGAGLGRNFSSDPDYSFDKGDIVSNRLDILTELDVVYKDRIGFRISAAGWYDHAYSSRMGQGDGMESLPGDTSGIGNWSTALSTPLGELSDEEEDLHYRGGELLDAFLFANWNIGDVAGNVRAGRHVIYWGQSLLGTAAIASAGGAMNPLDFSKALSVPGSEAKELFMPTNKISTLIQLTDNLTVSAFYGLEYKHTRLPTGNTYFSPAAGFTDDVDLVHVAPSIALTMRPDEEPDDAGSDWGVNFSYYFEDMGMEVSAYYMNYADKIQNGLVGSLNPLGGAIAAKLSNPAAAPSDMMNAAGLLAALNGVSGEHATAANAANAALASCFGPTPPAQCANAAGYFLGTYAGYLSALGGADSFALDVEGNPVLMIGDIKWAYADDIDLYGLSVSKQVGDISIGVDLTYKENAPLRVDLSNSLFRSATPLSVYAATANLGLAAGSAFTVADFHNTTSENYSDARGDTLHLAINGIGLLQDNGIWEGGSWIAEATFGQILDVYDDNNCMLAGAHKGCLVFEALGLPAAPMGTEDHTVASEGRISSHVALLFRPQWYQVMPGVDLTVPVSIGYGVDGNGTSSFLGDEESGSASLGFLFEVDQTWSAQLSYNAFFGPVPNSFGNYLKDRDNVSLTFKRTL